MDKFKVVKKLLWPLAIFAVLGSQVFMKETATRGETFVLMMILFFIVYCLDRIDSSLKELNKRLDEIEKNNQDNIKRWPSVRPKGECTEAKRIPP
jgi:hypothetical protein